MAIEPKTNKLPIKKTLTNGLLLAFKAPMNMNNSIINNNAKIDLKIYFRLVI